MRCAADVVFLLGFSGFEGTNSEQAVPGPCFDLLVTSARAILRILAGRGAEIRLAPVPDGTQPGCHLCA